MRFISRTPIRTFILYPVIALLWEYLSGSGNLHFHPLFLPSMLWGYLQYRLCGLYRIKRGGGGPGLDIPPERLVSTGPYACTRNPMYLGHIIFLTGLTPLYARGSLDSSRLQLRFGFTLAYLTTKRN